MTFFSPKKKTPPPRPDVPLLVKACALHRYADYLIQAAKKLDDPEDQAELLADALAAFARAGELEAEGLA